MRLLRVYMSIYRRNPILIDHVVASVEGEFIALYGEDWPTHRRLLKTAGRLALEVIGNTTALYHDLEHTALVVAVGMSILKGKQLYEGDVSADDWLHAVVALLCHDIGYVRGILPGDSPSMAVINEDGAKAALPADSTDAFLTPWHVDRGKMFVRWRFRENDLLLPDVLAAHIERTRFPVTELSDDSGVANSLTPLMSAADLIGQLADPHYLRKLPALYHEFVETGADVKLNLRSFEDLRAAYPGFFWSLVSRDIRPGLRYLRVTDEGRRWEASLLSHVFSAGDTAQG
jgi:hypothetical protein